MSRRDTTPDFSGIRPGTLRRQTNIEVEEALERKAAAAAADDIPPMPTAVMARQLSATYLFNGEETADDPNSFDGAERTARLTAVATQLSDTGYGIAARGELDGTTETKAAAPTASFRLNRFMVASSAGGGTGGSAGEGTSRTPDDTETAMAGRKP